jgi:hypothetical protein
MRTSTVPPQLLSLDASSAVAARAQAPAFRSPLLEKHDQMLKQWQQANKIHRPLRRGDARPGGGNDDSDEDLEAGLPLLSRDKAAAAAAAGGGVGGGKKGGGGYGYGGVEVREDYDEAVMFLKDLCESLHLFGAPAHRIEYNMTRARYLLPPCPGDVTTGQPSEPTGLTRVCLAMASTSWRPTPCSPSSAFCPSARRTTGSCYLERSCRLSPVFSVVVVASHALFFFLFLFSLFFSSGSGHTRQGDDQEGGDVPLPQEPGRTQLRQAAVVRRPGHQR